MAGRVLLDITMSLDGFVAGPNDSLEHPLGLRDGDRLHDRLFAGDTPSLYDASFRTSGRSGEVLDELFGSAGAMVVGRRTYDVAGGWGGEPPIRSAPVFVVTHRPRAAPPTGFTFVTDGIESALGQARAAAGDKDVFIGGGANTAQQFFRAGLLDEARIHLAPILLGQGVRLFDDLGAERIDLEPTRVIEAPGITHLTFRVGASASSI